jgi:putative peptide zinc metalloprotease protein
VLEVREDSKIVFSNISWRKDNGVYILWKEGTSNFIELADDSFLAYMLLKEGKTPRQVAEILKEKFNEIYDVKDFIQEFAKLGFISFVDGIPIPSIQPARKAFDFLKKGHVSWIYSRPLLLFYSALIFSAFIILFFNPLYLPSYADFFFADSYILVLAVSFGIGMGLVFFHELAHLIAGKAAGVDGYFSIGMRLYIPVAETNLTQLWTLPRNKRFIPFLAGMLNDTLLLSFMVIILWVSDVCTILNLGSVTAFAKLVILLLYYSLIWQFLLFIRTDLYYAISNLLSCRNLYSDSWTYILNLFLKRFKNEQRSHSIPDNELKVVKVYAPLMLIATVLAVSIFALWGLPIFVSVFIGGFNLMLAGFDGSLWLFIEGLILTCLMGLPVFGFIFFMFRSIFRVRRKLKSKQSIN